MGSNVYALTIDKCIYTKSDMVRRCMLEDPRLDFLTWVSALYSQQDPMLEDPSRPDRLPAGLDLLTWGGALHFQQGPMLEDCEK